MLSFTHIFSMWQWWPSMPSTDVMFVLKWWLILFLIGLVFLPLTTKLFLPFLDRGYIFAKILGTAILSYVVFLLGLAKVVPFSQIEVTVVLMLLAIVINGLILDNDKKILSNFWTKWRWFLAEEVLFFIALLFWSYMRGFAPDIHGLEKYMDFGFVNSILKSTYFPPDDMWFPPYPINYYYFGHLVTAVLTKLSGITSNITFNLMLGTLFAYAFTTTFSLATTLIATISPKIKAKTFVLGGVITAFFLTFCGNLHTIYTLFSTYNTDTPQPPWQMHFTPSLFPNAYWYPNATRFIYHTIHEFPMYSFVVSDLHGHVLDIQFVLLTISLLFAIFLKRTALHPEKNHTAITIFSVLKSWKWEIILVGFLLAVMYMTNAWDGMIYFLLASMTIGITVYHQRKTSPVLPSSLLLIMVLGLTTVLFAVPFSISFKPASIVHGIGVLCAPNFLVQKGHIGPFLFEADHCQHSPLWQLGILYGFFYFWAISLVVFLQRVKKLQPSDVFVLLLIVLSTILIIIPEFFYMKDIYPAHYRANTMFKLVYQSFMMLSIASGYALVRIMSIIKTRKPQFWLFIPIGVWTILGLSTIILVGSYPYFAITSYYNFPKIYYGLDGTNYLKNQYPNDYAAIQWINTNISDQPVILEAQGDSYTDYARVSSNTGLPTVLGWTVHEWLWRGTYDVPAPRITDVTNLYTSPDIQITKQLLQKYHVKYVFIGTLERQKYSNIDEEKFAQFGKIVYQNGTTKIYKLNV